MMLVIVWIVITAIVLSIVLYPRAPKKPHEREWGSGKDLSALAVRHKLPLPSSSFDELEEWWQANKSKDARIRELEELVTSKSSLISKLLSDLAYERERLSYLPNSALKQQRIVTDSMGRKHYEEVWE